MLLMPTPTLGESLTAPPSTFGKFRILDRIAAGTTAEVYRARVDGINGFHRPYAIKRILPHLTRRAEFVEVLIEEAKIAGMLSHANIVQIMDLGQIEDTYYIAMEYVDGPDLGRVLSRCREKSISMPVPHAIFCCLEILKGLEYAHGRQVSRGGKQQPLNIVHRDISPSNILMSFRGEIKLSDFGIANASIKALEGLPGLIRNRFHYTSPEQIQGNETDQRADLFSTGVVLYELLTSTHPFVKKSEAATLRALRGGDFPAPSLINPDVPRELDTIVQRTLSVNPDDRFSTATAMKESLDRFFHQSGFIFTHTTMVTFLDGLFPNRIVDRSEPEYATLADSIDSLSFTDSGPLTRPLDLTDEDPPTEVIRRKELVHLQVPEPDDVDEPTLAHPLTPSFLDEYQDISQSSALGPIAGDDEENTVIRRRKSKDIGDQATTIKQRPRRTEKPKDSGDSPTIIRTKKDSTAPETKQKPTQKTRQRTQLSYMVFGAMVTGLVLWVGILLGGQIEKQNAKQASRGDLRLNLPDDAIVFRGDEAHHAADRIRLRPEEDEMVNIGLPDYNGEPLKMKIDFGNFELEIEIEAEDTNGAPEPETIDSEERGDENNNETEPESSDE